MWCKYCTTYRLLCKTLACSHFYNCFFYILGEADWNFGIVDSGTVMGLLMLMLSFLCYVLLLALRYMAHDDVDLGNVACSP